MAVYNKGFPRLSLPMCVRVEVMFSSRDRESIQSSGQGQAGECADSAVLSDPGLATLLWARIWWHSGHYTKWKECLFAKLALRTWDDRIASTWANREQCQSLAVEDGMQCVRELPLTHWKPRLRRLSGLFLNRTMWKHSRLKSCI